MPEMFVPDPFMPIRRAFAMMALAMASDWPREKLTTLPTGFRCEVIPYGTAVQLQNRVVNGDVTCIVPNPEPFTYIFFKGTFGELRTVYGIWIGKAASWRGTIAPPKRNGVLTREEALAKGIPLPDETPSQEV